jgi:hypothetical protein
MRTFETGATRDSDIEKLDYEGFLSPLVLERFARYMHAHRIQADGSLRDSDNWQKGIPFDAYMKSAWRHFMEVWREHRTPWTPETSGVVEEALCALLFNIQGYLHELLMCQRIAGQAMQEPTPAGFSFCGHTWSSVYKEHTCMQAPYHRDKNDMPWHACHCGAELKVLE